MIFVVYMHGLFLWKIKKDIAITNAFQKPLDESNRKLNKIWVDRGSEFYNRSMKLFLQNNNIEMHSMHNEEKSVVAGRFVRTLMNKLYKCMTSISKNVNIDELDDIVNKSNNTYHRTIKMEPVDVKYIYWLYKKIIKKVLNSKLVIMLEYQNMKIFLQKAILQIGLKKFL